MASMTEFAAKLKEMNTELNETANTLVSMLLTIPNVPEADVPLGGEENNRFVRKWGAKKEFTFKPLDQMDLTERNDLLDLKRAAKMSGSGFVIYKGKGASLERALINFFLDFQVQKNEYTEMWTPYMVNRPTITGTGQLPKLEDDMYRIDLDDMFLIPTAEVSVTNYYADEILAAGDLPQKFTAFSPCFRREAGSAGKDTRGILRVHQFDKVEMVKFVEPEKSYDELELLVKDAEEVLQTLGLNYRILELCTGDISFSAAKCYDIELWAPGHNGWLEVSSCSNFEDFQARRLNCRYKDADGNKKFVHTLNGSGMGLPRIMIAIMENYQQADGSIIVPEVLRPWMGGIEVIQPE